VDQVTENDIIREVEDKFGEHLEMAGEEAPLLMISILARMLIKEREATEYYKRIFTCQH
jgi:hypothetical protein